MLLFVSKGGSWRLRLLLNAAFVSGNSSTSKSIGRLFRFRADSGGDGGGGGAMSDLGVLALSKSG